MRQNVSVDCYFISHEWTRMSTNLCTRYACASLPDGKRKRSTRYLFKFCLDSVDINIRVIRGHRDKNEISVKYTECHRG